jgi:flagellar biosynthesis/type III secretory pathway protein FliH
MGEGCQDVCAEAPGVSVHLTAMEEPEKREIQEELKMVYKIDQFIDGNPRVEERIERAVAQRIAQGHAEGKAEGMQRLMLDVIKDRFPVLADQAQLQIEQMRDAEALETLFRQLITATAEGEVRRILHIWEKQ